MSFRRLAHKDSTSGCATPRPSPNWWWRLGGLEVRQMRLALGQCGVQIAEAPFERTAAEDRVGAGGLTSEIHHLARLVHRCGDGDAQLRALRQREPADRRRGLPDLLQHLA